MDRDPWVDLAATEALVTTAREAGATASLHTYPGTAHLFADPDLPDHDPHASAAMLASIRTFLAG